MKKTILLLLFTSSLFAERNNELSLSLLVGNRAGLSDIAWHLEAGLELKYNIEIFNYKRFSILPGAGICLGVHVANNKMIITNIDCIANYKILTNKNLFIVINPTYYTLWNDPFVLERSPGVKDYNHKNRTNHVFDIKGGFRWGIISLLAGLNTFEIKAVF